MKLMYMLRLAKFDHFFDDMNNHNPNLSEIFRPNNGYSGYTFFMDTFSAETVKQLSVHIQSKPDLKFLNIDSMKLASLQLDNLIEPALKNSALERLGFPKNNINPSQAMKIGFLLSVNTKLKQLDLQSNSIGDEGLAALLVGLSQNKTLEVLSLWNNNLTDNSLFKIADYLKTNPCLKGLNLGYHNFSIAGLVAIRDALQNNNHLIELTLNYQRGVYHSRNRMFTNDFSNENEVMNGIVYLVLRNQNKTKTELLSKLKNADLTDRSEFSHNLFMFTAVLELISDSIGFAAKGAGNLKVIIERLNEFANNNELNKAQKYLCSISNKLEADFCALEYQEDEFYSIDRADKDLKARNIPMN